MYGNKKYVEDLGFYYGHPISSFISIYRLGDLMATVELFVTQKKQKKKKIEVTNSIKIPIVC